MKGKLSKVRGGTVTKVRHRYGSARMRVVHGQKFVNLRMNGAISWHGLPSLPRYGLYRFIFTKSGQEPLSYVPLQGASPVQNRAEVFLLCRTNQFPIAIRPPHSPPHAAPTPAIAPAPLPRRPDRLSTHRTA
jgi:hypothetical protein